MNLTVQAARLLLEKDKGRVASQLQRLEELAAGALREIQALVSSLRPVPAVAEDLPAALRRLAVERRSRDGLQVALDVVGDRKLSEPVAAGLYLIAQEALTNVAKHAGVDEATVRLRLAEGDASLEVEDRGRGFPRQGSASERGHLGLAGMAERARDMGWRLTIESQPGHGTRIRVAENVTGDAV
jgi:signal transduction histidine kinase